MAAPMVSHGTILGVKLPSCAILALESCLGGGWGNVLSYSYNKLFQLSQSIYLGCYGDFSVIKEVKDKLRVKCPELQNDRSLEVISVLVEEIVNEVLRNRKAKAKISAGFLLIGIEIDNRFSMYTITKGDKTWKYLAKKEEGMVAMVGSEHNRPVLETHLKDNNFTEHMSEEEAVRHALETVKYETHHGVGSGGAIKVVVVSRGVSTIYKWEQDDPSCCMLEYHEQPRIRIPFDQALAPRSPWCY